MVPPKFGRSCARSSVDDMSPSPEIMVENTIEKIEFDDWVYLTNCATEVSISVFRIKYDPMKESKYFDHATLVRCFLMK
jgi:hypothetical protein